MLDPCRSLLLHVRLTSLVGGLSRPQPPCYSCSLEWWIPSHPCAVVEAGSRREGAREDTGSKADGSGVEANRSAPIRFRGKR